MINNNIKPQQMTIGDTKIRVVNDHQYTLLIWGQHFQETQKSHTLISIDYHPDTNPPFWLYAYQKAMAVDPDREEDLVANFQQRIMASIDPLSPETIVDVMDKMRNDEHINTAMALGYLKDYHMINCMEKHQYPTGNHYLVEKKDFGSLEDTMFADSGFKMEELIQEDFILDIDLDYFSALDNFKYDLKRNSVFKELVKGASLITIARSVTYFDYLKKENFTIEDCEDKLMELLEEILKNTE